MASHGAVEGGIATSYPTMRTLGQKQTESFGNGAIIKIPIDPDVIGLIIGKRGRNSKRICRETGLGYLSVAYSWLDSNRRRQDVLITEGSLDSIIAVVHIVRQILNPKDMKQSPTHDSTEQFRHREYKTKLCFSFSRGKDCPYAESCRFAHVEQELITNIGQDLTEASACDFCRLEMGRNQIVANYVELKVCK